MLKMIRLAATTYRLERVLSNIRAQIINMLTHGPASNVFGVVGFGFIDNNTSIIYPMATRECNNSTAWNNSLASTRVKSISKTIINRSFT